jgi:molybdopterin molybdotransferase/putative molybdopterin biosynthesis protein
MAKNDVGPPVTRSEALEALKKRWQWKGGTETVPLLSALGRVCSEDIASKNTLPVFRSAGRDGIAVRYADFANGLPDTSNWKKKSDYGMADTGDDFDDAFDTVIAVESLDFSHDMQSFTVRAGEKITAGQSVNPGGSRLEKGEILVRRGTVINSLHQNMLASGGYTEINVQKRPNIAYIPTGNELVSAGTPPERGQNIESNGVMVESIINSWGGNVTRYPICLDILADLEKMLSGALANADIVLVNGGSSKGSEDYNTKIIREQSSFFQHRVKSVPGLPVGLAIIAGKPVINIPGPPIATFCVLDWCVRPLYFHAQGAPDLRHTIPVTLKSNVTGPVQYDFYQGFHVAEENGGFMATPLPSWHGRIAASLGICNAFAVIPAGTERVDAGAILDVTLV